MSQLADVLDARQNEIIDRWTDSVRHDLNHRAVSPSELVDHLPALLQELARSLRSPPGRGPNASSHKYQEMGRAHGAQRFRLGFDLDMLVREYGLLRGQLFDLIEENSLLITLEEVRLLTDFVANSITEAVSEYGHQKEAERERLLQETERLRATAELGRARLSALFMQAPVAIAILRGSGLVIDVANPLICRLWGRTLEQVLGKSLMDAMPELQGQGFDTILYEVMRTGVPFVGTEIPAQLIRIPGQVAEDVYFNFVYEPLRDEAGAIEGIIAVATEVTEAVLARREAQRLAQEESARRGFEQQLIGIVSHDLRNPLGAILLGMQLLLRREDLDARTINSLARLQTSAERAVRMVRDLLDFTQARLGGGLRIDRKPVDLHAVVRASVDELQATHPERELRLEQGGNALGPWDADRFAQVVGNLVGNALKYSTPDTPVHIRVLGDPQGVLLEVHNWGEPIPADALPRLFQPLHRAVVGVDNTTRSVGLGLYIVDQIVRAHGGTLSVTSTGRDGTTFTVRLPRGA